MRIGFGVDSFRGYRNQPVPEQRLAASIIDAMIEEGILAERAGFHSVRVPDRHGRTDCYLPGCLQILSVLARETRRVAIGAFALVNTLYHPMLVAEQCAIIDNLSRGRLFMTWARGKDYWEYFGVPKERMLARFVEHLEVLHSAFSGEPFSHHGEFYDVDAVLSPRTYQRPRFPYWGAGLVPAAIERCATYAEAWAADDLPFEPARWLTNATAYRQMAARQNKVPFVVLMRNGWVADTYEQALEQFGNPLIEQLRAKVAERGYLPSFPAFDHPSKVTPESIAEHVVMGTADQCLEQIDRLERELGVDYVTMRFRLPSTTMEATRDQIVRFGEEVVAPLHRRTPAPVHLAIPEGARW